MKQSNNQTLVKIPFSGFYNSIENEKVAKASYYKKSKLARMNKEDLTNLADEMLGYGFDDSTKQTLIDGLMLITNKDYYTINYDY